MIFVVVYVCCDYVTGLAVLGEEMRLFRESGSYNVLIVR